MRPSRCVLLFVLFLFTGWGVAQSVLDSLLKVLPSQSGAARVLTLGEIQWELGFSDPPKAEQYGVEALRIAEMSADSSLIATAANDLAITEYRLGHYPRSIALNTRALRIRTAAGDSAGMAASHSKLGVAYTEVLSFDSALVHDYAAERIYVARGELVHAAQVRGNMGRLYQQEGDLDAAERVARETVDMLTGRNEPYAEATALGQLAHILVDRQDMDATLDVAERAVKLFRELDAKAEIASLANILGIAYRRKGDDASGLKYYREALEMSKAIGDRTGETVYLANIANVLSDGGRTAEALPLYESSIALARAEGYPDQLMSSLEGYAKTLEKAGRKGDALAPMRELLAMRDSLYKTERIEALSDMQVKYETQRTEKELLEQQQRNLEQRARIDRQRLLIGTISVGVLFTLLGAWLVVLRQRARAKTERDAALLDERERGLKAVLDGTEQERRRLASELHDGVGQQLAGLKLRLEDVAHRGSNGGGVVATDMAELMTIVDDTARDVRGIAHSLRPRALDDLGLVHALDALFRRTLAPAGIQVHYEHHGFHERLSSDVEVGVYRIAQELVTNIIKHAEARTVNVQLLRNKDQLILIVEDDGRGMHPDHGTGIGLLGMRDRARALRGHLILDSAPGKGFVTTLRVPLRTIELKHT